MFHLFSAVFVHAVRLMSFRHDGSGLPETRGVALAVVLGLAAASRLTALALTPVDVNLTMQLGIFAVYFFFLWKMVRPVPMAAVLLTELAENMALAGLYASVVTTADHAHLVRGVLFAWAVIALVVFFNRLVKRLSANAKS